jgi:hypothetical protein
MDDRPVGEHRLEVIDSGSGERLYSAMREQGERRRDFQRRVRWLWLRRDLADLPEDGVPEVIDLPEGLVVTANEVPPESRQADSA